MRQLWLACAFTLHVLCIAWWLVSCYVSRLQIDPDTALLLASINLSMLVQCNLAGTSLINFSLQVYATTLAGTGLM